MNNIKKYTFSELYEMSSGISTTKAQAGHGYPFVSFGTVFNNYFLPEQLPDLMDTSEKEQDIYSIKEGDILITRTSETINELAMSCVAAKDYPKATYSGFTKRLRPKTTGIAYHKYLAFYLRGYLFRKAVTNNAFMTLRASFNEDILSFLNLYLPGYQEQVKIGDMLYNMEQKITVNQKICSELEAMAKAIYDYWFVQFDFPDENGKPYRTSGGEMIWNEQLKREIPKGWEATRLGNICDFRNGINYDKDVEGDQEYRIINVRNISSASLLLNESELDKINLPSVQADKYLLSSDDIVIARSGTPGATRLLWKINEPTIFCGFIICSTPHEALHKIYLTYCLKRLEGTSATKTGGSILQNVSQDTLKNLFVLIPDREVLRQFNAVISLILEKIHSNIDENNELTKLRDWLLPMLMNGQAWVE